MDRKYSVLLAVYAKERAEYFEEAVESMLRQTAPPDDFVIVCDGPLTAALDTAIESFVKNCAGLFQIIRLERNQGLSNALNTGIKYCRNELIARMDSDDISLPGRCEKQLERFELDARLALCGGQIAEFYRNPDDAVSVRQVPCGEAEIRRFARIRNPVNHMSAMFRKSAVLCAGGYQSMHLAEDYYLWVRMLKLNMKLENLPDLLVYARIGNGMYKRRGGGSYAKSICGLQLAFLKLKFINPLECARNCCVRLAVSLLPDRCRMLVYQRKLRGRRIQS